MEQVGSRRPSEFENFNKYRFGKRGLDSSGSGQGTLASSCDYDNELQVSIKG
jgi:hypothetical protein